MSATLPIEERPFEDILKATYRDAEPPDDTLGYGQYAVTFDDGEVAQYEIPRTGFERFIRGAISREDEPRIKNIQSTRRFRVTFPDGESLDYDVPKKGEKRFLAEAQIKGKVEEVLSEGQIKFQEGQKQVARLREEVGELDPDSSPAMPEKGIALAETLQTPLHGFIEVGAGVFDIAALASASIKNLGEGLGLIDEDGKVAEGFNIATEGFAEKGSDLRSLKELPFFKTEYLDRLRQKKFSEADKGEKAIRIVGGAAENLPQLLVGGGIAKNLLSKGVSKKVASGAAGTYLATTEAATTFSERGVRGEEDEETAIIKAWAKVPVNAVLEGIGIGKVIQKIPALKPLAKRIPKFAQSLLSASESAVTEGITEVAQNYWSGILDEDFYTPEGWKELMSLSPEKREHIFGAFWEVFGTAALVGATGNSLNQLTEWKQVAKEAGLSDETVEEVIDVASEQFDEETLPQEEVEEIIETEKPLEEASGEETVDENGNPIPTQLEVDSLEVNKDIPQFKEGADPETGEVHPIEGDFDPLVAGNILVWEKLDGTREVATGRHRLASAKRSGQKTISAMVLKEADGWSLDEVFTLDAQSNIKDGKGSINDYYQYFKNTELTEAEARREGLLQISKANKAFQLAKNSSEALQALWRSGDISDTNAALIAEIGKGHHDAQDAAIRYKKLPTPQLRAMVESLIAFKGREVPKMRQTDLFDHDESLKQIEAVAKLAAQKREQVETAKRTIASLKNRKGEIDAKKAERAEKEFGVKIESVEAANQKLAELEAESQRFVKWHSDPELRDALFEEAGFPTKKDQAEAPEPPDDPPDPTDQELTPEQQDLIAENYGLSEKMAQSFSKKFPNVDPDQFSSEASFALVHAARKYDTEKGPFPNFASRVIQNKLRDVTRRIKRENEKIADSLDRPTEGGGTVGEMVAGDASKGDAEATRQEKVLEASKKLTEIIDQAGLSDTERAAIDKVLRGVTYAKVAEEIGKSVDAVKHAFPRAMKKLREIVGDDPIFKEAIGLANVGMFNTDDLLEVSDAKAKPLPFTSMALLMKTLQADAVVSRRLRGALGMYVKQANQAVGTVVIRQEMFAMPDQLARVAAHEIGHLIDHFPPDGKGKSFIRRLKAVAASSKVELEKIFSKESGKKIGDYFLRRQAFELSKKWRPFDEKLSSDRYNRYRRSASELYADFVSVVFVNPELAMQEAPDVYYLWLQGLQAKPGAAQAYSELQDMLNDPAQREIKKMLEEQSRVAAKRFEEIRREDLERRREAAVSQNSLRKWLENLQQNFSDDFTPVLKAKKQFRKSGKLNAEEQARNVLDALRQMLYPDSVREVYNNRIKRDVLLPILSKGMTEIDLHEYLKNNRIVKETSSQIEWIKNNPDATREIGTRLAMEFLNMDVHGKRVIEKLSEYEGDELVSVMAELHAMIRLNAGSKKRADSLVKALERFIEKNYEDSTTSLLSGFNVRGFIANPQGLDATTAQAQLDFLQERLGNTFSVLEEGANRFYQENFRILEEMKKAGMISERLWNDKIVPNKDNYATFSVLKYFEEDPKINAAIKEQYGTLNDVGNTFYATAMKMNISLNWLMRQRGQNAVVNMWLEQFGDEVRKAEIPNPRRPLDVKKKPDKGYLTKYLDGKPVVYEFDSRNIEEMFHRASSDVHKVLLPLAKVNGIARPLWTVYSPAFILWNNKTRDRAILSSGATGGKLPRFHVGPFYTFTKLDHYLKPAKELARKYINDGEIDPMVEGLLERGVLPPASSMLSANRYLVPDTEENAVDVMESFISFIEGQSHRGKIREKLGNFRATEWALTRMEEAGAVQEIQAKIAAHMALTDRGFTQQEADEMTRMYFGIPDPRGGGRYVRALDRVSVFGRVHIAGWRAAYNLATHPKTRGEFWTQYLWANALPVVLKSGAKLAGGLGVGAWLVKEIYGMFGDDEEAEKKARSYQATLDRMSEYEKSATLSIPLGFIDSEGSWKFWWATDPDEIAYDWKAFYFRQPAGHTDRLLNRYLYESFDRITDAEAKPVIQMLKPLAAEALSANPALEIGGGWLDFIRGNNPSDSFYGTSVLKNRVFEAGGSDVTMDMLLWSASKMGLPAKYTKYDPNQYDSFEKFVRFTPVQSVLGISSFGLTERSFKDQEKIRQHKNQVRLQYGEATSRRYREYNRLKSKGSAWRKEHKAEADYDRLRKWLNDIYSPSDEKLIDEHYPGALEKGIEELEKQTKEFFK